MVERLASAGHQAYPVGGAVRDLLLKRKVGDWDVATSARPEQVVAMFSRVIPTGIAHGTVTVLQGGGAVEVTTFRGDLGYSDGRHPDQVVFLDSLAADLQRRDFTVNAIALELSDQTLVDPFGGQADLRRRIIRAVGDPRKRFFEDGLRPLRAVRFACVLGFSIEQATFDAIGEALPVFRQVANERVREELLKILSSPRADQGIDLLRHSGLLEDILPELLPGIGFAQNRFHRHDVYQHSLKSLKHARGDGVFKFAVLIHDAGKPPTAEPGENGNTFYGHEQVSVQLADQAMSRLRFSRSDRQRVKDVIAQHMFHYQPEWTDGAVRRFVRKVGRERLSDLWEMRRADCHGRGPGLREGLRDLEAFRARVEETLRKDAALKVTDLAIDGHRVMESLGIGPGPRIGLLLEALLESVMDDPSRNNPEALCALLRKLSSSI